MTTITGSHGLVLIVGIPPKKRGEAWHFLAAQYQAKNYVEHEFQPSLATRDGFVQLCEERTPYEHNIFVDIGEWHHMVIM